ncbi:MAG: hypothetical protein NT002_08840 [candidate division Zixibacteria bacterium]|nr:hypothetical protein [candidate division Zixibacteria bacterium]
MTRLFKLLLVLSAFAVVLVSTAMADTKDIDKIDWNRYITINPNDPDVTALTNATIWKSLGTSDVTISETIATGTSKWLGIANEYYPNRTKEIRVLLTGTNLDQLQLTDQYGVIGDSKSSGVLVSTIQHTATTFEMKLRFNPQPSWEVLKLTSTGSVTITKFYLDSQCPVPTLTQYGLGVLVLLLIATAFVVYRRRHRVIA